MGPPQDSHLNIKEEEEHGLKEAGHKVGKFPHHAWSLLPCFAEGNKELCSKLTGRVFKLVCPSHLKDSLYNLHQLLTEEPGVSFSHLNEELKALLSRGLVTIVQASSKEAKHGWDEVLELVSVRGLIKGLDKVGDGS